MFPAHFIHTPLEECSFRLWINIPMLNNSATARSPAVTARPVKTPVGVFVGFFLYINTVRHGKLPRRLFKYLLNLVEKYVENRKKTKNSYLCLTISL